VHACDKSVEMTRSGPDTRLGQEEGSTGKAATKTRRRVSHRLSRGVGASRESPPHARHGTRASLSTVETRVHIASPRRARPTTARHSHRQAKSSEVLAYKVYHVRYLPPFCVSFAFSSVPLPASNIRKAPPSSDNLMPIGRTARWLTDG
jgi:hypothetical protein